jgi:hypothetical protein
MTWQQLDGPRAMRRMVEGTLYRSDQSTLLAAQPMYNAPISPFAEDYARTLGQTLHKPATFLFRTPTGDYFAQYQHSPSQHPHDHLVPFSLEDAINLYDMLPAQYVSLEEAFPVALDQVESQIRRYLDDDAFRLKHPRAFDKWAQAEQLLSRPDAVQQLTAIGHLCREAMQAFATELIEHHRPASATVDQDPQHTVARIQAVIAHERSQLGKYEKPFLDALIAYWGTTSDLVQRQEHGAQKEGEALTLADAQRVVFHTAIAMFEVDRSLGSTRADPHNRYVSVKYLGPSARFYANAEAEKRGGVTLPGGIVELTEAQVEWLKRNGHQIEMIG